MTDPLLLPDRADARVLWVFTADLDPAAFEAFVRPGETWPLAQALGVPGLKPGAAETFLAGDLQDYGLSRYLTEAHGLDQAEVGRDEARLDALTGPVVLLFARDLPAGAARLDPTPPLAFIGRYEAPYRLAPSAPHSPSASTRGQIAGGVAPAADPAALRRPLWITLAVLVALALLVLALF